MNPQEEPFINVTICGATEETVHWATDHDVTNYGTTWGTIRWATDLTIYGATEGAILWATESYVASHL